MFRCSRAAQSLFSVSNKVNWQAKRSIGLTLPSARQLPSRSIPLARTYSMATANDYILTLTCPDKPGIVHAVTGIFAAHKINIVDLQQFSDPASQNFFMRVHFGPASADAATTQLTAPLEQLGRDLQWSFHDVRPAAQKTRVLIMVSKIGHCLNDLLFRARTGQLRVESAAVVSNHPEFADLCKSYGIPFHHLPVTKETKQQQEEQVLQLVKQHDVELVVLARYMQVLSPTLCTALSGRIINIHHSFLPSFKGAKPYHQAFERGVKIIGATAHFVTADLDEGPIIEQRVARVDHAMSPAELVDEGSNVESQVLAAAVKWYAERRVFLNVSKTVVFN
jgi:formyltetrahydrofolate deformylase